jgi:hypothetical protein
MKKLIILILLVGLVGFAHYSNTETTEHYATEAPPGVTSTQATTTPSDSFKKYPDHVFNAKEYIEGMLKGGDNLLIWRDPSVNFSQYNSVEVTEFGGRLLPEQNVFSYDPYIAHFNSVFKTSLRPYHPSRPSMEEKSPTFIEESHNSCLSIFLQRYEMARRYDYKAWELRGKAEENRETSISRCG